MPCLRQDISVRLDISARRGGPITLRLGSITRGAPWRSTARAVLAQALQACGSHAESILEATLARSLDPHSAYAYGELGAVRTWGGRPRQAISPLRAAIRLSPLDPRMSAWLYA